MFDMKTLNIGVLALAAAMGQFASGAQRVEDQELTRAREFADRSLRMYVSGAIRSDNAQRFGFKTLDEAREAKVGEPIPVLFIGLTALKGYRPGAGAASVLRDAQTLWFPVLVNGGVRSEIEISRVEGKWIAGEFGRPAKAREVANVYDQLPRILQSVSVPSGARASLVRIPAIGIELFYTTGTAGDFFVAVRGEGLPADLEVGKAYPADALLTRLAQTAQKVDEKMVH
jgi:hypothetical protein